MTNLELKKLQALCNVDYGMDLVACIKQRIEKAEASTKEARDWGKIGYQQADEEYKKVRALADALSRVRGLLQRYIAQNSVHDDYMDVCAGCLHCESVKLLGAKSADIGKLDSADKSGKVIEKGVPRKRHLADFPECADCREGNCDGVNHFVAGSAETGGEKAAPTVYLNKTYPVQESFSRGEVLGLMHAWAETREPENA